MRDLNCRAARRLMQAPNEVPNQDLMRLDAHVRTCDNCREAQAGYAEVDRHIVSWLQQAAGTVSVRSRVRAQLEEAGPQPLARTRGRGRLSWPSPPHIGFAASLALIVMLLAIALPQSSPGKGHGPTTASASWRLVRAEIGYPIALDPRRADHLMAGAYGQVYESWNGGKLWRQLAPLPRNLVVRDLAIDASDGNHYLVAVRHSVYASYDAGKHWRQVVAGLGGAENMFLQQDPRLRSTFYLGPSILWKSPDGGRSWRRAGTGSIFAPNGIQALAFAPNGDLYTAILGHGVAVSRDGGRTWQSRARGLPPRTLSITVAGNGTLWAATYGGVYRSTTGGRKWEPVALPHGWLATGVAIGTGYVLAAGDHAVYRSSDGGRHWSISMRGLPLDPYVYGLTSDPLRPGRVYASLNSDGIFRSDDGGRTWSAMDNGLPVHVVSTPSSHVLFVRRGALWITDRFGTDPGQLTVEHDVRLASLTPDGAGVAYVAGKDSHWSVRVLGAGGSAARTVETRHGALPWWILWSPNSTLLAVVESSALTVIDPAGAQYRRTLTPDETLIGWAPNGQSLLFWSARRGAITARTWGTWYATRYGTGRFPGLPLPAPDGHEVAMIWSGRLFTGSWKAGLRARSPVNASCGLSSWSSDSTRILLRCGKRVELRLADGKTIAKPVISRPASWAPGTPPALLFFQHGSLWTWSARTGAQQLVKIASPARG